MRDQREERFIKHINDKLEEPVDETKLEFYTWKSLLGVRDIDFFHQIAKALGIKELKRTGADLSYETNRVPGGLASEYWCVELVGEQGENFLEKYGEEYNII